MVSMLGILIPVVVIALVLFIIFAAKNEVNTGGDEVVKKVYIYMVLFVTLMMIIGGSVSAFMAVADIISPTVYQQSFDEYARWQRDYELRGDEENGSEESLDELRERYDVMREEEENSSRRWAFNNLIKSFGWIIIPFPIFLIFQRKLKELGEG